MGRTIVITGCSSGFGRLAAERLAREGHRVYATMRDPAGRNAPRAAEVRDLAERDGLDLRVLEMDVTDDASVAAAAARAVGESGPPDVVINNAGSMFVGLAECFTTEEFARQLDVNLLGVHRVLRAFLPGMRGRGAGLVMNVGSTAGRMAVPFFGVYHASKWALEGYTQALRAELASSGVDVVMLEPGPFSTDLFGASPKPADADNRRSTYPDQVHDTFDSVTDNFRLMFDDPEVPTDPALAVDRMADLIRTPAGRRPFRSVVGVDFGVRELNEATEPMYKALLDAMGLSAFATIEAGRNGGGNPG